MSKLCYFCTHIIQIIRNATLVILLNDLSLSTYYLYIFVTKSKRTRTFEKLSKDRISLRIICIEISTCTKRYDCDFSNRFKPGNLYLLFYILLSSNCARDNVQVKVSIKYNGHFHRKELLFVTLNCFVNEYCAWYEYDLSFLFVSNGNVLLVPYISINSIRIVNFKLAINRVNTHGYCIVPKVITDIVINCAGLLVSHVIKQVIAEVIDFSVQSLLCYCCYCMVDIYSCMLCMNLFLS